MTTEHQVRSFVRRRRREHDRRRLSDRLIDIYTWLLATVIAGIVIAPLVKGDLVPHPDAFLDTLGWLPVVLFVATWGVLRFGTWQGPVLFTTPELQWELSSPLDRRQLVLLKLRRASVVAIGVGVVSGAVVGIAAAALLHRGVLGLSLAAVGAFVALALMTMALSWHVERSPSLGRAVDLATPAVAALTGLLVVAVVRGLETATLWSGPWGWATGPVLAQGGRPVAGWIIQAILLALAAVAAVISTVSTADQVSDDELWRRSEARSSASAALFFGNVRAARNIARRGRARGRVRGRQLRMVRLSQPLALIARDTLTLRRNLGLIGTAAAYVAVAIVSGIAATGRPLLVVGVFGGLYMAASRLLETIRLESDQAGAHRMLPWPWGTVMIMHCVVPVVVLTVLVWIGILAAGVGGFIGAAAVEALAVVAPFVAGALVLPSAISASRRSFPVEMLISGAELGALSLVTWLITGPVLALIALAISSRWILSGIDQGITMDTFTAIAFLATATFAFGAWLKSRPARDE